MGIVGMDYFELLELPMISGVSKKQERYAQYLRDKEVCENRDYYESIACSQWHKKLDYSTIPATTRIVLSCKHAGVIISTLKGELQ